MRSWRPNRGARRGTTERDRDPGVAGGGIVWRVMRQLLAESLALTVLGSVAGVAAAGILLQLLARQLAALPIALPHLQTVAVNHRVLLVHSGGSAAARDRCNCQRAPGMESRRVRSAGGAAD